MIRGKYDFDEHAFLECNFAYNDMASMIHEYTHFKLGNDTYFGVVNFIIKQIAKSENDIRLKKVHEILSQASTILNENCAIFDQLSFVKSCQIEDYSGHLNKLRGNELYYKAYNGEIIIDLLNRNYYKKIIESNIVRRIASLALNVDLTKIIKVDWTDSDYVERKLLENDKEINPDVRYEILIKTFQRLLKSKDVYDITDELLLSESNLEAVNFSKENFLSILNLLQRQFKKQGIETCIIKKNIINIEKVSEENFIIKNPSEEDIYNIFDCIRPNVLNHNYKICTCEAIKSEHLSLQVMRIILHEENKIIVIFYDVVLGKQYVCNVDNRTLEKILNIYKNSVMIFYEDYNELKNRFTNIKNKRLFLQIDATYRNCKMLIGNDISEKRETMIHMLNDGVFFLFVRQRDGNIFVMHFLIQTTHLLAKDINCNIFNIIEFEGSSGIDNCFCFNNTDWWKYEDIIMAISETYILDFDSNIPRLGHRVRLK